MTYLQHHSGESPLSQSFFEVYRNVYQPYPNAPFENPAQIQYLFSNQHDFFVRGKAVTAIIPDILRISGLYHPLLTYHGKKAAYFGFWETVDDLKLNQQVFSELRAWAKSEGAEIVVGPINFSTFGSYRIRVNGTPFDDVFIGEPFSPPYYDEILQQLGFSCSESYSTIVVKEDPKLLPYFEALRESLLLEDVTIASLPPIEWKKSAQEFYELTVDIFRDNPGYSQISFDDFLRQVVDPLSRIMCPYTSIVASRTSGEKVGYVVSMPNYGSLRLPSSSLSFDEHYPKLHKKMLVGKTVGVMPEFRGRKLQFLMTADVGVRALKGGYYSEIAMALMRDGNHSAKTKPPFTSDVRQYRLYSVEL